jgi:serine/threonine protein kinase
VICPKCQYNNTEKAKFCRNYDQFLWIELANSVCGHADTRDSDFCKECGDSLTVQAPTLPPKATPFPEPISFADGCYQVKQLLGEGGKKRVYLAHDNTHDWDVAFSLIKTEILDKETRTHIKCDAQIMG